jgi:hypothetical protein
MGKSGSRKRRGPASDEPDFSSFQDFVSNSDIVRWSEVLWMELSGELPEQHPLQSFQRDENQVRVRRLVATVRRFAKATRTENEGRADKALLELIRADPRYLLSPLIGAKALWWKLLIVRGDVRGPRIRSRQVAERDVAVAQENLSELTKAFISFSDSGGSRSAPDAREVLDTFDFVERIVSDVYDDLRGFPRRPIGISTAERIAAENPPLFPSTVVALSKKRASKSKLAFEVTGELFGVGWERMRTLVRKARYPTASVHEEE